jgi:L-lactate dehydrogenase complex protein LldE
MLERKLEHLAACGAERLVSCDMGCLLHLGGGLHRRQAGIKVQHISELLAEALP